MLLGFFILLTHSKVTWLCPRLYLFSCFTSILRFVDATSFPYNWVFSLRNLNDLGGRSLLFGIFDVVHMLLLRADIRILKLNGSGLWRFILLISAFQHLLMFGNRRLN